jgi:Sec-independent protein translocase protein TatA
VFEIGPEKILLILGAALLFLGPKELPAAARKLASGMRQLRSLQDTVRGEVMSALDTTSSNGSNDTSGTPSEPTPALEASVVTTDTSAEPTSFI